MMMHIPYIFEIPVSRLFDAVDDRISSKRDGGVGEHVNNRGLLSLSRMKDEMTQPGYYFCWEFGFMAQWVFP